MFPVDGNRDPGWQGNGECEGVTTLLARTAVQPIGETRLDWNMAGNERWTKYISILITKSERKVNNSKCPF